MGNNFGFQGGGVNSAPITGVESVTGLNTDNTDPQNPVVQISVDGVTIAGSGTPLDPLQIATTPNPQTINSSYGGVAVTGTLADTISESFFIPADTISVNGMMEILVRYFKTGGNGNASCRIYKNTINSLTGATLIAQLSTNANSIYIQGLRNYKVSSNTLVGFSAVNTLINDIATSTNGQSTIPFNTSVDNYIIFSVQLFSVLDSIKVEMARLVRYY